MVLPLPRLSLFPYTTLFRSLGPKHPLVGARLNSLAVLRASRGDWAEAVAIGRRAKPILIASNTDDDGDRSGLAKTVLSQNTDRKSTRLNSSHRCISYAVFCLNGPTTSATLTLSLHDALPIFRS